jgi:predicted O-linked N-acetylglucosamine transferase (SPINDLY family)
MLRNLLHRMLHGIFARGGTPGRESLARADRCCDEGDYRRAATLYREALLAGPQEYALGQLGLCQARLGEMDEAARSFQALLRLNPQSIAGHMNLGNIAVSQARLADASRHYDAALTASTLPREAPANADLANNLGIALMRQGLPEAAIACFRDVLRASPGHRDAADNLLFALQHSASATPEDLFAEFQRWAAAHEAPLRARQAPHGNTRDPERRLRLGYVSGDFGRHAVANFIAPVLAQHDRAAFAVYCYSSRSHADAQTAELRALSAHWRDVAALSDEALAQQVRDDGVDILVDLSGHTLGNRLLAFARKPAPVQMTWLGYPTTSGLQSMDYRITDAVADPPGVAERYHSEALLRLPHSQWCYRPWHAIPEAGPLPAELGGKVMFGSFNNLSKLNAETLALWARVLRALPESRMTVAGVVDAASRERIAAAMMAAGAAPGQLRILGRLDDAEFWRVRGEIDLVLDAHPYNGTTTTCEALWCGLPVVTLAGAYGAARNTTSLLHAAGLQELVARDADQFVAIATGLAGDIGRLGALRAGLRQRLLDAGLCDGARFTRELESLYRSAWKTWCSTA